MSVLIASRVDVPEMLRLAAAMHAESRYNFIPYDAAKMEQFIFSFFNAPARFAAVYRRAAGEVSGMLLGQVGEYYFSQALVASDILIYVGANYRGSLAAPRLIEAFVTWARHKGATEVVCGHSSGVTGVAFGRLMEYGGFDLEGQIYKKRLQ